MMKNLNALLYLLLLLLPLGLGAQTTAIAPSGSGTVGDPYQIASLANLSYVAQNLGATDYWASGLYFIQTADIDASETQYWDDSDDDIDGDDYNDANDGTGTGSNEGFMPIGNSTTEFAGSYDGQGYSISNLYIDRSSTDYVGLFGWIESYTCVFEDIHIVGGDITGRYQAGGLAGTFWYGDVIDCSSSADVSGTSNIGGLFGQIVNPAQVYTSYATGTIQGGGQSGGLVGLNQASGVGNGILRCYATGDVTTTGDKAGGLVGYNTGRIEDSYAWGAVSANDEAGGLVGHENFGASTITNCYAIGAVSVSGGSDEGGLIGSIGTSGTYSNNFWDTETSGQASSSGATGKTTAEMKTSTTFTSAGWDFMDETANGSDNYWGRCQWENGGYPFLSFQGYTNDCGFDEHGGYALDFDGSDDYVEIPYSADLNPALFTIEAWVKVEGGSGTFRSPITSREVFSAGADSRGYILYAGSDDQWQFWTGSGGAAWGQVNSNVAVTSEWTHVAGSYDGSTLRIYVNGELANSAAGSYSANPVQPLRIGVGGGDVSLGMLDFYFNGKIDDVRIWSDERTEEEIQANMHKELAGTESNLVAYYAMTDSSGTSVPDNTGNEHTGTFNDVPVWVTSGAHAGPNMALDFDGTDEVNVGDVIENFMEGSFETWVYWRGSANPWSEIFTKEFVSSLAITSANELHTNFGNGTTWQAGLNSANTIPLNEWTHLAVTRDASGVIKLYINGVEDANTATFAVSGQNSHDRGIGVKYNGASPLQYFNGTIDELRAWSDVRTEAEIRANMYRTLDGDEAGLIAYYRFDQQPDASHTTVYDQSSNRYDGTLTNMDPATDWVSASPFNTWIGSDDSDWSNADNWSLAAVPGSEDVGIFEWGLSNTPTNANITGRHFYLDQGVTMSTTGDLTLSGDYYNAGTFTTTGDVTFSGSSAQTIRGTGTSTFGAFIVNNAAGVTMEQDVEATSGLTLTAGLLQLGSQTLTLGTGASVSGTPGTTNHVVATSGTLRKGYSGTGSFSFPVGDGTTYSPISLNFTSGVFASAYADVSLTASKHPNNSSSNHYIERYWTVSSSGISSFDCTVTGTYDDGDIQGTESELYGGKWNGASWNVLAAANTGSNQFSGTVSSFSDFTAGEIGTFPVEWLSFEATPTGQSVQLDWSTGTEQNSYFFAIERSADEEFWNEIGQIPAAGNSEMVRQYQFTDQQPDNGLNYYRLRQVDLDGTHSFSEVRSVSFQELGIRVYPNPVENTLHLDLPAGDWNAELLDGLGRSILSVEQVGRELDLSQLPAGTYQLRLTGSEGQQWNTTVVK